MLKIATTLSTLLMASIAFANDAPDYKSSNITGDWQGRRQALHDKGVNISFNYTLDSLRNFSGGLKRGNAGLDNLDIFAYFDGEKLWHLPGNTVKLYFLSNNFDKPNMKRVSSAQGIDNIEVGKSSGKIFEAWMQQNLWQDKFSLLAGLYNLNSEFYITNSAGVFINSTYGLGSELGFTGVNGPSIFNNSAPAVRLKLQPTQNLYAQFAVFNGVAGDPKYPHGTHARVAKKDGALAIGEIGFLPFSGSGDKAMQVGKYAVGMWRYTHSFGDQFDTDNFGNPSKRESKGGYVLAEQKLYSESKNPSNGLTAFVRFGKTAGKAERFDYAMSAGFNYTGIITGRDSSILGIGYNQAKNSKQYLKATTDSKKKESGIEVTYQDQLAPGVMIQPDFQYIINPGTTPGVKNATVVGVRLKFTF